MKKIFLTITAVVAMLATSCSSDDDNNTTITPPVTVDPDNFQGTFDEDVTLDASLTYNLSGPIIMKDGTTLTIPAGTVIEATGTTSSYIAISQGAKINVNGTADNPVVMTSGEATQSAGDWGGLVICGKAPINNTVDGGTAISEVGDLTYGGSDSNDNSGSIKYLRVEYTGATFNGSKEFNGVSFFGVGAGTTADYIQSYKGGDDGIEFFGGTVNGSHLVTIDHADDSIDFADGWSGTGEYWYIKDGDKAGIEGSNNGDDAGKTPLTTANVSKVSIVNVGRSKNEGGIFVKEGGGEWTMSDIFISDSETGIFMKGTEDDPVSNQQIADDKINFTNVKLMNINEQTNYTGTADFISEAETTGAGAGADLPAWAQGWTKE
ncbi:hypothetical protein [Aureivirga sp. CE67]|uniref:hypothetical protein n=1 Tax=Aureivirga sp. CE67 TaxID=1788983 RepID=UPI0018CB1761|nr:hypothetical protein [Aureivirga sp. CE67]